jgi:amino acid transporter
VSIAYLAGTIIQGLIILNDETYVFERWHGTLLVIAITTFSIFFNTFLAKRLPMVEALILILHIVGLFAIIIPLWVLAPRASAKSVFTEFNNAGGWNSLGTSTLVGFSTTITAMIGYDCAVHMCKPPLYVWSCQYARLTTRLTQPKKSRMPERLCPRR